ncbi:hypothetical protein [Pseudobacteroides cellulosolvens]|uniref:Uncharacterized protein n=1 Tax=Pseudobacteroides cellulosolvens ATCC 35603 = DSM 2933 TaxID=398512 RepID=A0A0L6JNK4_9FIRM|nr:hypothetical protein [Pseudobacteroides cellulosolvens]KNY27339.1 hypothetical protein Bccel_2610 [Pseudobacteroides cellulosolvens ATCC 35603 = DSM 2933]
MSYIVHYFRSGTQPFNSLTDLDDEAATKLMNELYVKDSLLWERFSNPKQYLDARRGTEKWLLDEFIKKGGNPLLERPIYFVLGGSIWFNENETDENKKLTSQIQIPLEIFDETEISFTYPDSMLTLLLAYQKDPIYYLPEYHGKIFTLKEILNIKENLKGILPEKMPNYIEVQVWNKEKILCHLSPQQS